MDKVTARGLLAVAVKAAVSAGTVLLLAAAAGAAVRHGDQFRLAARARLPWNRHPAGEDREVAEFAAAVSRYDHGPRDGG